MIDTHAHLDFPDFKDDLDEVLQKAREASVKKIVNIGVDLTSSQRSVNLTETYPHIFAAIGVHPHDAKTYSDQVEQELRQLANNFKVVAIGEIGLDFYRDLTPREKQREVFVRQIALARSLSLPIVIHIREAYGEAIDILVREKAYQMGVVLHCFSGSRHDAFRAIEYGFMLSFGGVLTFTNSRQPDLVKELPIDRILLETDAPYLTPHPFRGQRNHPALVRLVYEKLATIHGTTLGEIESIIDRNAEQFFEFE
jgi:TatD DNase family protein